MDFKKHTKRLRPFRKMCQTKASSTPIGQISLDRGDYGPKEKPARRVCPAT